MIRTASQFGPSVVVVVAGLPTACRDLLEVCRAVVRLLACERQSVVRRALVLLLGPHILILSGHVGSAGLRLIGCRMSEFPVMWPFANVLELL